jgi:hypothetical protein
MSSFRKQRQNLLAVLLGTAVLLSSTGCTQPIDQSGVIFRKAHEEEAAGDLKQAEQYYLACIASSIETKSRYYHLAAINRLTELEKKLNNQPKSKIYMNQAATFAENNISNDKKEGEKKSSSESENLMAQECHLALMRLADWLYEDGNFVSARKLYEKAAELEKTFHFNSSSETSAEARIKILDSQAKSESDNIETRLEMNRYSKTLRGPAAAQRSEERHRMSENLARLCLDYQNNGDKSLADETVALLSKLRDIYGPREDEYRRRYCELAAALNIRDNFALLTPLVESDLKEFSSFSRADLDAAIPEAVENATFYTQDLLIMAEMRYRQKRYEEMLELCRKVETLAPKVLRENSELEVQFLGFMALALEFNNQKTKALPYRKKHLEKFRKTHDNPVAYSDFLHHYQLDLIDAGMNAEAENVAEEIIKIKRTVKGESHIVPSYLTYATALIKDDKHEKARQVLLEALPNCRKYKDKNGLLGCYALLSQACAKSHPEEAIAYSKSVEDLLRKNGDFGAKHMMAEIAITRATAEIQTGKSADAARTLDRAIEWQLAHKNEVSAYTAGLYNLKAAVLGRTSGDWTAEKKCRSKAIDICRGFQPPQPGPLASTLIQTAFQYEKHQEFGEAEKHFREAIGVLKNSENPAEKETLLNSKAALAGCLKRANKNPAEVLSLKNEILPVYKSRFTNVPDSDLSLCLVIAELCTLLQDKTNLKLVMQEAESIYAKNKTGLKAFDERIEFQRKALKAYRI